MVILLSEFDFPHVKLANSGDLVVPVYHRRGFTLSLREYDVDEILQNLRNTKL